MQSAAGVPPETAGLAVAHTTAKAIRQQGTATANPEGAAPLHLTLTSYIQDHIHQHPTIYPQSACSNNCILLLLLDLSIVHPE